jgi:hypothetical protein
LSRIRLGPMLLILIVSLAIFFAGWQVYKRYNLVDPLKANLSTVSGVQNVDVVVGNPTVIHVKLGEVGDLQTTYKAVSDTVTSSANTGSTIVIEDNKDKALQQTYESLWPIIGEGVHKGNYQEMISSFEKAAAAKGVQAKVTMDIRNIYVQLEQGNHYLYDVSQYNTLQQGQGGAAS